MSPLSALESIEKLCLKTRASGLLVPGRGNFGRDVLHVYYTLTAVPYFFGQGEEIGNVFIFGNDF